MGFKNKEYNRIYQNKWYHKNKDKRKKWYEENKEEILEKRKQKYHNNPKSALKSSKKYRDANKEIIKKRWKTNTKKLDIEKSKILDKWKSKGCIDCGFIGPNETIDAHHIKDKKYNIGRMFGLAYSIKTFEKELCKCIPICRNCHAVISKIQGNWERKQS